MCGWDASRYQKVGLESPQLSVLDCFEIMLADALQHRKLCTASILTVVNQVSSMYGTLGGSLPVRRELCGFEVI